MNKNLDETNKSHKSFFFFLNYTGYRFNLVKDVEYKLVSNNLEILMT